MVVQVERKQEKIIGKKGLIVDLKMLRLEK